MGLSQLSRKGDIRLHPSAGGVSTPWARQAGALGQKGAVHAGVGAGKVGGDLCPFRLGRAGPWVCLKRVLGIESRSRGLRTASLDLSSQPGTGAPLSASPSVSWTPCLREPYMPQAGTPCLMALGHGLQSSSSALHSGNDPPSLTMGSQSSLLPTPGVMFLYFRKDPSSLAL